MCPREFLASQNCTSRTKSYRNNDKEIKTKDKEIKTQGQGDKDPRTRRFSSRNKEIKGKIQKYRDTEKHT